MIPLLVVLGLSVTGCEDEEDDFVAPAMEASVTSMEFDVDGGSQTLTLTSTRAWSSTIDADWITISPSSGKASKEYTITVTVLPDTEYDREANIYFTFNAGTYEATLATVYVSQPGELGEEDEGSGTYDDPYTVTGALSIINNGEYTDDWVYVHGYISQIDEISTSYGNATYYISDDGTTDEQLEVYHGYGLGNTKFTSEDDLQVGDEVIVYGELTMYYSTPEVTAYSYIVYLNGESSYDGDSSSDEGTPSGSGTSDDPYNVAAALEIINDGTYTSDDVYVTGTITAIDGVYTDYGNATYYISDDGVDNELEIYRGYYLDGASFTSEDQIAVGDVVVVCGELTMYYSTPEMTQGSYIVSINEESGSGDSGETYTYSLVSSIESGSQYLMVVDDIMATPLSSTYTYGYLYTDDVTWSGSQILAGTDNAFTFTSTTGGYYIQDGDGRYYYATDDYNSYNVSSSVPSSGGVWSVDFQSDGTAKITSTDTGRYIQYSSSYSSFGCYTTSSGTMPYLYVLGESSGSDDDDDSGSSSSSNGWDNGDGTVTDQLTHDNIGVSGTSYAEWSGVTGYSSAVYAGQSAGGTSTTGDVVIQLRSSNSNSGIVTTGTADLSTKASEAVVQSVSVTWNSGTSSGRVLNIYGSSSAYSAATDLYDSSTQGTLIGTIEYDGSTTTGTLEISDSYQYIGLRSSSGALYLDDVQIVWGEASDDDGDDDDDDDSTASGSGTADDPYNVAAALEIINAGTYTSDEVYVTGTISSISEISTTYGNATYYLSDDGTTDSDQLMVFRGYSLNGDKFTSSDEIEVGDVLVIYGELTMYYSTPEVTTGSSIISINGSTGSSGDSDDDDDSSSYTFTQASSITSGNYYVLVADGYMSTTTLSYSSYGYISTNSVTVTDGTVSVSDLSTAFIFVSTDGGYYITDSDGYYYYMTESYNSFNKSTDLPSSGAVWTVSIADDGTATITNVDKEKYIQLGKGYTTYGSYSSSQSTTLPTLYEYGESSGSDDGDGDDDEDDSDEYASNIEWTVVSKAYSETATVNEVEDVSVLKLGTSSAIGSATITIPANTSSISFYAVSWKGSSSATLSVQYSSIEVFTQAVSANDGATGNSPYTITVSDTDKYTLDLSAYSALLTSDLTVTLTTQETVRVILFGLQAN